MVSKFYLWVTIFSNMLSVVVPLYNEEENVVQLHQRLTSASDTWGEDYELIFVNDGSYDNTIELLKDCHRKDNKVKVVDLSRNFGHQAAISAGIKCAKGDAVVVMDGDLQDPPEELSRFLDKWREGYHVVYAIRTKRKENIFKRISYKLFYRILAFLGDIDIPLDSGDFCVMDKRVINVLNNEMIEVQRFIRGLRAYAGFRQIGVKSERASRAAGEVKYTFKKLLKLAIDGILDFSSFPLRISTYLGFLIAIPSFIFGVVILIQKFTGSTFLGGAASETPGLTFLTIGVLFLFGLIMIMLGIMGEYVGRIYMEVKRRPTYIINEIYDH